jgi:dsRNA-specific ribonuclease
MGIKISADTKSIGDVFETMIGAYFTEKGFEALHEWVKRSFESLIDAAAAAFDQHQ